MPYDFPYLSLLHECCGILFKGCLQHGVRVFRLTLVCGGRNSWFSFPCSVSYRICFYSDRAEPSGRSEVSWASQNMLVLGLIILVGLLLHLYNFWGHMQFAELAHIEFAYGPADGFAWIVYTFSNPVFSILYLIWICALWFHLTHGFWSAMHTLGMSGKIWMQRWQCFGMVYVTILMAVFVILILSFWLGFAPSMC